MFTDVAFVAYANEAIRSQVDPALRARAARARSSPREREPTPMWMPETKWPEEQRDYRRALAWVAGQTEFFDPRRPVTLTRAPGRLDVMGGIADYSGALVLEMPIAAATWVAAQPSDEPEVVIQSDDIARCSGGEATVTVSARRASSRSCRSRTSAPTPC